MIQTREIDYRDENTVCKGYVAFDDSIAAPRPAVLVSHMVGGREEFVENKARQLAALGYVGFALDMYGEGRRGATLEESRALMRSLLDDRALLARRIRAALTAVRTLPEVDAARVAAIGFCFGGLCVLDLARTRRRRARRSEPARFAQGPRSAEAADHGQGARAARTRRSARAARGRARRSRTK